MSQLASQLALLRERNAATPSAAKPSLLLDARTARNTTADVLHTMAILGYDEIRKELMHQGRELGEELLEKQSIDTNRNALGKQENKILSGKLIKFLLMLSPLFLNRGCQAVIEYLLHIYNIHIFEGEQLALLFIQYWQHEAYSRLIANIHSLPPHLHFLQPLQSRAQQINLTYIVKSLAYSRSSIVSLLGFTKQFMKLEKTEFEEVAIQLESRPTTYGLHVEESTILKRDIKQFVIQVLSLMLRRRITGFNKEIS
jgi:hypothetical protein